MITRKLATLGLGLALAMGAVTGIAGANAAQPAVQAPVADVTSAQPAKVATAKTASNGTARIGTAKSGTKSGAAKLNSGRSVAVAHKPMHRRLHVSLIKAKHRIHVAHKSLRTHVAHVAKKGAAKHA